MAITNATRVADFGSGIGTEGAVLQVDNTNNRLGVGTTNPQAMLQVGTGVSVYGNSGIVSATSFYGGGANITALSGTNIASGTVAAARVATLNQNTSGTAGGLTGTPEITVRIQADNFDIIDKDASETMLSATVDGAVTLRYNGIQKFITTTDGTRTSGIATVTAIDGGISAWVLGANGTNHYTFTGPGNLSATDDPQIELQRGQTYVFRNRSGGHPFRIQSTVNGSTGTQYSTGVTNNDGGDGTDIIFDVPFDAPNILYYQCTSHANMGGAMLIGERAIPARDETSQATLVANDAGKVISTTTGGWVVPTGVLAAGDAVTLINKSGSGQTITCSAVTMYNAGDGSTVTSRTLGARGVRTIWFESDSVAYISGAGLS